MDHDRRYSPPTRKLTQAQISEAMRKIYEDEVIRQFRRSSVLAQLGLTADHNLLVPAPPPPWYARTWWRARAAIARFRERLGEIIAGRKFSDGYDD